MKFNTRGMNKSQIHEFWSQHVNCWKKSDETQRSYCKKHNISYDSFSKWKRRIQSRNMNLIEVDLQNVSTLKSVQTNCEYLELIINEKIKLKLSENFNPAILKKVISCVGDNL